MKNLHTFILFIGIVFLQLSAAGQSMGVFSQSSEKFQANKRINTNSEWKINSQTTENVCITAAYRAGQNSLAEINAPMATYHTITINTSINAQYKPFQLAFFKKDKIYANLEFTKGSNSYSALVQEGTYDLIFTYTESIGSTVAVRIVVKEQILVDKDVVVNALAEDAIHELAYKVYNHKGEEPGDMFVYDFMFCSKEDLSNPYDLKYFLGYTAINMPPTVLVSDVSDRFTANCFALITPLYGDSIRNSYDMVKLPPLNDGIYQKKTISNDYRNYAQRDFQFVETPCFTAVKPGIQLEIAMMITNDLSTSYSYIPLYGRNMDPYKMTLYMDNTMIAPQAGVNYPNYFVRPATMNTSDRTSETVSAYLILDENKNWLNIWTPAWGQTYLASQNPYLLPACPTQFIYSASQEVIHGNAAPIFFSQSCNGYSVKNSAADASVISMKVFPYGQYGETYGSALTRGSFSLKINDQQVYTDTLKNLPKEMKFSVQGKCELTINSNDIPMDSITQSSKVIFSFDQAKADANPPSMYMFRVLNRGHISNKVDTLAKAVIEFTAGDYSFSPKTTQMPYNQLRYLQKPSVEVFWSKYGTTDWKTLSFNEVIEKFDSTTGNFFRVPLENITGLANGEWANIKIVLTDAAGNSTTQELYPAFKKVDSIKYITSINNIATAGQSRVYPNPFQNEITIETQDMLNGAVEFTVSSITGQQIYSKSYTYNNENIIKWNGRNGQNTTLPKGLYIYQIKTSSKTYTGKLIKN